MKKRYQVAAIAMAALTAGAMSAPSVYAQTSLGRQIGQRISGVHRGPFDREQMLKDQATVLGITVDDMKARIESGKTFKDIMTDLGLSADQIKSKMDERRTAMQAEMKVKIQQEVTDGKITQAEADKRIAWMEKGPQGVPAMGRGFGMMGQKGDTKFLDDHASILGITVADLKTRLDSGKTVDEIAKDLGISEEALQAKRKAYQAKRLEEMKAKIAQEVTDGKITQSQADKLLERLTNPGKHGFGRGMGFKESGVEGRRSGMGSPKGFGGFRHWQNGFGSASASQQ